ncbi:MAG: Phenazine biosynthesis-like protein, partial [Pseudomonadota bacterium]
MPHRLRVLLGGRASMGQSAWRSGVTAIWNMQLRFHTLDVFTATAFAGNPLAVVHDAD